METRLLDLSRRSPVAFGWARLALAAGLLWPFANRAAESSNEPRLVPHGTAVVQAWQPHQRLYVKGDLGVSAAQLAGLEQWLDTHATNWVVVLLENAAGETYTDPEGQTWSGIEAVNHALGKGLMNRTDFGQSLDPRTGERNACFFALFLKDRRFSYYGSDAQDRRGLGEEHWIGNLDAPAISAMRNGGRVLDAVKDTVTTIESRLTARLQAEREAAARQVAERELVRTRAAAQAQADVAAARGALQQLTRRLASVPKLPPEANGDLVRPDLATMNAELATAEQALAAGQATDASRFATAVRQRVDPVLEGLDRHAQATGRFEEVAARYQQQAQHPRADAASGPLREAADRLQAARREHARGDSSYEGHLAAATVAIEAAQASLEAAERAAQSRRLLLAFAGSASTLVVLLLGVFLNRRRVGPRQQARSLLEVWRQGMREKTDGLFALLDRRATVVGTSTLDAERRYAGQTLELSRRAIQDVDELFIMSASVDRILAEAQTLLEPGTVCGKARNFFLRRAYLRALRLLQDEPVRFQPGDRVELIVRGPRTERDRLLGDLQSYQPFALTFQELIEAFNQRAARALAALDRIESSTLECTRATATVEADADAARTHGETLAAAAAEDGLLNLETLRRKLLPAVAETLAQALHQAAADPVGALAGPAARAQQQAGDARALAAAAAHVRLEQFPRLREHRETLQTAGLAVGWIDDALEALSASADSIASAALEASTATAIQDFARTSQALAERLEQTLTLHQRREEQTVPAVAATRARLAEARRQLGTSLDLDPARTLVEQGLSPDERLAAADAQLTAARASLDRGDVAASQGALEAVDALVREAGGLIDRTSEVFERREREVESLRAELRRLEALLPDGRTTLTSLAATYAADTLLLGAGDPAHPQANGTVHDNLEEAQSSLSEARARLQRAEAIFATGRLLEAADFWTRAQADLEIAAVRLQEIEEKRARLQTTAAANARRLAELESRAAALDSRLATPATMRPTLARLAAARQHLPDVRSRLDVPGRNPFTLAAELDTLSLEFDQVEDQARCDRDVFEEARRSVKAAFAQGQQAEAAAAETARSGLTPSPAMVAARGEVPRLVPALDDLENQLRRAHEDWNHVDAEADRLTAQAAHLTATLKGELDRARSAVEAISAAATTVRSAGAWTGRWKVLIQGAPGSDALEEARVLLQRGAYAHALAQAETARRMAAAAMAEAEAEMRRREAAERARQEHERAARQAAEMARRARRSTSSSLGGLGGAFGGGSSHGGFGGRSSWGGTGSGTRTSGFRSGSGARTSGW
jgi:hypothetical protein